MGIAASKRDSPLAGVEGANRARSARVMVAPCVGAMFETAALALCLMCGGMYLLAASGGPQARDVLSPSFLRKCGGTYLPVAGIGLSISGTSAGGPDRSGSDDSRVNGDVATPCRWPAKSRPSLKFGMVGKVLAAPEVGGGIKKFRGGLIASGVPRELQPGDGSRKAK